MSNYSKEIISILFIPSYRLYPADGGSALAQLAYIEKLQYLMDVSVAIGPSNVSKKDIRNLEKLLPKVKFLNYGYNTGGKQGKRNIKSFLKRIKSGLEIVYRKIKRKKNSIAIDSLLYTPKFFEPLNQHYVEDIYKIIQENSFDIIQTELLDSGRLIDILPDNVCRVFVHHEIKFERMESQRNALELTDSIYLEYLNSFTARVESSLINRYDAVLCFTERDAKKIQQVSNVDVYTSPFPVNDCEIIDGSGISDHIDKIVFIGAERHYPNKEGIEWFIDGPWKKIKESNPTLKLFVIGEWSKSSLRKFKDDQSIVFTGFINDLNDITKNSIWIVPIKIGGGLRTKILTGMAKGSPVVTTSFAAEGISAEDGKEYFIANSSSEFVFIVNKLIHQPELAKTVSERAIAFIKREFNQFLLSEERFRIYQKIINAKRLSK